ncbi:ECF transporter S component [Pseudoclavibacter sp. 13-3]|uniref:ECF transporter S component n=1 Tax=Pseudoclavibacter sp. 13-3 TaxID=2901228 RepID=UPI001E3426A5|nr:ECF transporter S component [Pseudoclavibacter sp. 13-3]MCD7101358.1 ECF transporter S component [Pseudoclavibacter sp. 13-3]
MIRNRASLASQTQHVAGATEADPGFVRSVWHWSTRELLVAAVIGAFGAVITAATKVAAVALYAVSPMIAAPMTGTALFVGVLAASLIRRPGAALVAGFVAAVVVTPFGGFNPRNMVAALVVAFAVELAMLLGRYRRFGLLSCMVAALINAVFLFSIHWFVWHLARTPLWVQVGTGLSLLIGQLLWAEIGVWLAGALRRAGLVAPIRSARTRQP